MSHGEFAHSLDPADGRNVAHGAMNGASVDVRAAPDFQDLVDWDALQSDGQADAPSTLPSSDGACRKRIYEQECPYRRDDDGAWEPPMFRLVEHFPERDQPYIGDSYGNQVFVCADEAKACSCQCACRGLGSQSDDFAFIATKTPEWLSIDFRDSALCEVVAAVVSGEVNVSNGAGELWDGTTCNGFAVLAQHARLKQHLERLEGLDTSLSVIPALRLLVDGFLADGHVFKSFEYNSLFERGYLSLDLWKKFQHHQLDDDITLLDDSFTAVADERGQESSEHADVAASRNHLVMAAEEGDESMVRLLLDPGELAAKRRSQAYMEACYKAFVQDYGRVTDVARRKQDELAVRVCDRFVTCRAAWKYGITTLRGVSRGQLPKDPGELLAFLCVCNALSKTLDFFNGSEYAPLFLADLRRWGLLFEDRFDCYRDFIQEVWEVDIANEPPLSPSAGHLLQYAQGQQRWFERHATLIDADIDVFGRVRQKPPDGLVPETPWLGEEILHQFPPAHTSGKLVILMTGAIFAIILIFLLWLRTASVWGIEAASMCPSLRGLRGSSLPIGHVLPLEESCVVLETYLGLRSKAHEVESGWAAWNLNTISTLERRASSSSPSQARDAQNSATGLVGAESSVAQKPTFVFSVRMRESGRRRHDRFCFDCQREFTTRSNYRRHRREQHGEQHGLKQVICPDCGKRLSRPDYVKIHSARGKCRKR